MGEYGVSLSREWRLEVVLAASDLISLGFSDGG